MSIDRRQFMRGLGLAGLGASAGWAVAGKGEAAPAANSGEIYMPFAAGGTGAGPAFLFVAAVDAPASVRSNAQFMCSGNNDHLVINQALNSLAGSGGTVLLSEGSYDIAGAIRMPRRTALQGKGRSTQLVARGTWTAFDNSGLGAVVEPAGNDIDKTRVSHLAIDGKRFTGADVKGIYYNISDNAGFDEGPDAAHVFSDLYIVETRQHGIHLTGARNRAATLARIRVYNVGAEGATVAHGFLQQCPDAFFDQCEAGSCSGSGFYVDGSNNRYTNCKSWFSDLSGWQIRKPRNQFAACESQDNEEHGYYITTGPNSLVGCHADSNSWNSAAPTSSFDGFHIPFGNRIQLVGCSAYDKNESNRGNWQRFGFFVGSGSDHVQIIGTVDDNASAGTSGGGIGNSTNMVMVTGQ